MRRILVGGVGCWHLSDLSLGSRIVQQLRQERLPDFVDVEDLSHPAIAVLPALIQRSPYERMVLITAVRRGREPGELYLQPFDHQLPTPEELQARFNEAAAGVVHIDNLLCLLASAGRLPPEVELVEVEPVRDTYGVGLTPEVQRLVPTILDEVRRRVLTAPLGSSATLH